jgi:hypothetical protein
MAAGSPMTLDAFIASVDKLVCEWNGNKFEPNAIPRIELAALYAEVRNSTAFELATAQRERDEALRQLHRKLLE